MMMMMMMMKAILNTNQPAMLR